MTQDGQVRKLFCLLSKGDSLCLASLKTGMDQKTARKYRKAERMPSELSARHDWRTRSDPFSTVWELVEKQLQENPGLQAKALFAWLQGSIRDSFRMASCGRFNVAFIGGGPRRVRRGIVKCCG